MTRSYSDASIIVRNALSHVRGNYRAVYSGSIVRVYDSVAGYWTGCHDLTPAQCARVRRLASC